MLKLIPPLLAVLLILTSCIKEEIELPPALRGSGGPGVELVVEGVITNLPGRHYIRLTTPGRYDDFDTSVSGVTGATVLLIADDRTIVYAPTAEAGLYATDSTAALPPGSVCELTVTVGELSYRATDRLELPDRNPPSYPFLASEDGPEDFFEVEVPTHTFGYPSPAGLVVRGATVTIGDTAFYQRVFHEQLRTGDLFFTHSGAEPQGIFPLNTRSSIISGDDDDVVVIYRLGFSPGYYDHLVSVLNLTDWAGGLFSTVPGNATTNLSAGGAGYFSAIGVRADTVRIMDL